MLAGQTTRVRDLLPPIIEKGSQGYGSHQGIGSATRCMVHTHRVVLRAAVVRRRHFDRIIVSVQGRLQRVQRELGSHTRVESTVDAYGENVTECIGGAPEPFRTTDYRGPIRNRHGTPDEPTQAVTQGWHSGLPQMLRGHSREPKTTGHAKRVSKHRFALIGTARRSTKAMYVVSGSRAALLGQGANIGTVRR